MASETTKEEGFKYSQESVSVRDRPVSMGLTKTHLANKVRVLALSSTLLFTMSKMPHFSRIDLGARRGVLWRALTLAGYFSSYWMPIPLRSVRKGALPKAVHVPFRRTEAAEAKA